ncbi:MAG: hypothetical protein QF605_02020, partial [Rhodospirillales bacterium]|nr:hypothetical protein [Rhodospirillales bacterium]
MLNNKRRTRPVELGPYPLERLHRDSSVLEAEAARPPVTPAPMPTGSHRYLVQGTNIHLDAFEKLREPEPFHKKAPVPDELTRRSQDIKGAGYFLDASMIGICEIPANIWLGNSTSTHTHAVAVLVEYGNPIDADNKAADWVAGNEHLL